MIIPSESLTFNDGTAYISLENVSNADAFSETVVEVVISGLSHTHGSGDTTIPFAIYAPAGHAIDPRIDYAVLAWVDCQSNGRMDKGDLASDQIYRVLARGFGAEATVILKQIG